MPLSKKQTDLLYSAANLLAGGHHTYATHAEMLAIPTGLRRAGMFVTVSNNALDLSKNGTYVLDKDLVTFKISTAALANHKALLVRGADRSRIYYDGLGTTTAVPPDTDDAVYVALAAAGSGDTVFLTAGPFVMPHLTGGPPMMKVNPGVTLDLDGHTVIASFSQDCISFVGANGSYVVNGNGGMLKTTGSASIPIPVYGNSAVSIKILNLNVENRGSGSALIINSGVISYTGTLLVENNGVWPQGNGAFDIRNACSLDYVGDVVIIGFSRVMQTYNSSSMTYRNGRLLLKKAQNGTLPLLGIVRDTSTINFVQYEIDMTVNPTGGFTMLPGTVLKLTDTTVLNGAIVTGANTAKLVLEGNTVLPDAYGVNYYVGLGMVVVDTRNVASKSVKEYATFADLPNPGATEILYIDKDTKKLYHWGTTLLNTALHYIEVSSQKLYTEEGQLEDGSMTQKAATNALAPISITYADLQAAITAKTLKPGRFYNITNRPEVELGSTGSVLARATRTSQIDTNALLRTVQPNYLVDRLWGPPVPTLDYTPVSQGPGVLRQPVAGDRVEVLDADRMRQLYGNTSSLQIVRKMPFKFKFANIEYNTVFIDSNGRLVMGDSGNGRFQDYYVSDSSTSVDQTDAATRVPPIIALFWDGIAYDHGHIRIFTTGVLGARKFVVEFFNGQGVGTTGTTGEYTGQIILEETTNNVRMLVEKSKSNTNTYMGLMYFDAGSNHFRNVRYYHPVNSPSPGPIPAGTEYLFVRPGPVGPPFSGTRCAWEGRTFYLFDQFSNPANEPSKDFDADWALYVGAGADQFGNAMPVIDQIAYDVATDYVRERRDGKNNVISRPAMESFPWGNPEFSHNILTVLDTNIDKMYNKPSLLNAIAYGKFTYVTESNVLAVGDANAASVELRVSAIKFSDGSVQDSAYVDINIFPVPASIKVLVSDPNVPWTGGEMPLPLPVGSLPNMKYVDAMYRYEYMLSQYDVGNNNIFTWVRTAKV